MRGVLYTFNKSIIHCPKHREVFITCWEGEIYVCVCVCVYTHHSVYGLFPKQISLFVTVEKWL